MAEMKIPVLRVLASSAADMSRNQSSKVAAKAALSPGFALTRQAAGPALPSAVPMAIPAAVGYSASDQ